MNVDYKKKEIFILVKGLTQGIGEHSLTSEKICIQLTLLWLERNFVWTCVIVEEIVIYLLMVHKFINLKQIF